MQHLEVSCVVRPIQWPLGVKWLSWDVQHRSWLWLHFVHIICLITVRTVRPDQHANRSNSLCVINMLSSANTKTCDFLSMVIR